MPVIEVSKVLEMREVMARKWGEDAAQAAVLEVLTKLKSGAYDPEKDLGGWVFVVGERASRAQAFQDNCPVRVPQRPCKELAAELRKLRADKCAVVSGARVDGVREVERYDLRKQIRARVEALTAGLSSDKRALVWSVWVEGESAASAALRVGIKRRTAENILYRAKKKARKDKVLRGLALEGTSGRLCAGEGGGEAPRRVANNHLQIHKRRASNCA